MSEETRDEITRHSARLRKLSEWALALLPLLWVVAVTQAIVDGRWRFEFASPEALGIAASESMPAGLMIFGAMAFGAELFPVAGAVWTLRKLLRHWQTGEIFTDATVALIRRIGFWLVAVTAVKLAVSMLAGPAASLSGATSDDSFFVQLSVGPMAIGVVIVLLARVMQAAVRLQHQADLTI